MNIFSRAKIAHVHHPLVELTQIAAGLGTSSPLFVDPLAIKSASRRRMTVVSRSPGEPERPSEVVATCVELHGGGHVLVEESPAQVALRRARALDVEFKPSTGD